jgi:hypothetical protein
MTVITITQALQCSPVGYTMPIRNPGIETPPNCPYDTLDIMYIIILKDCMLQVTNNQETRSHLMRLLMLMLMFMIMRYLEHNAYALCIKLIM